MSKNSQTVLFFLLGFFLAFLSTLFGATDIFDLSVDFQGAQRLVAGQTLYRDFSIPFGPLPVWLLVPIAANLNPGWALLIASGGLGGASTAVMHRLLLGTGIDSKRVLAGTLLTAFWFLPPMGAFYHDHLSYLFILIALFRWHPMFFLVLALHCKQTVGAPAIVVYLVSEVFHSGPRAAIRRGIQALGWLSLSLLTIALCFDFSGYWFATVTSTQNYFGAFPHSLLEISRRFLHSLFFPFHIDPVSMIRQSGTGRLLFYPVVACAYLCLLSWVRDLLQSVRPAGAFSNPGRSRLFSDLVFTTLLCGALLGRSFSHLFFGLGGALVLCDIRLPRIVRCSGVAVLLVLATVFTLHGRGVFTPRAGNLHRLSPLTAEDHARTRALQHIIDRMKGDPGSYYLIDNESALLPLALGVPPVNRYIDYHSGTTIPPDPKARLQWQYDRILEISRAEIRYVIWSQRSASQFRLIGEYLKSNYTEATDVNEGAYLRLLEKRKEPHPSRLASRFAKESFLKP